VAARLSVPLSVLDLCPVPTGESAGEALRRSVDLARHAEGLGFTRYWVAEHHNLPGIASSAPAVLAGQIAAATNAIRVGSGGVMLPNHPPLTVAEQFGTLEALHPGRIDLGIGRAPGTDRETARALRRSADGLPAADFASQLAELQTYFAGQATNYGKPAQATDQPRIRAIPAEGNEPAIWLLGSTGYSAELAGRLGLPFAFAYHLTAASAANARPALALYQKIFTPSATLKEPYSLISVSVLCANDAATAHWLHGSTRLAALRQRAGRPVTLPSPEEAATTAYSAAEQAVMAETTKAHVVGDPATVISQLAQLVSSTGAHELMVTTSTFAHAARLNSYELLAQAQAGQTGQTRTPGEQRVASALSPVDPVQGPGQVRHPGRPLQTGDPAEGLRMPRVVHRVGRHRLHAVARTDVSRVVRRRALEHLQ
jgi:luciferase family oxidoreductase group 1